MDNTQNCRNCHFYRGMPLACRYHAPTVSPIMTPQGPGFLVHPPAEVPPDYWCGRWESDQPPVAAGRRILQ